MSNRNATKGSMGQRIGLTLLCASGGIAAPLPALATTTITQIAYDAGDHVTRVTDPRGLVTTYAYDGLDHLWQQVSPDTGTTTYGYDSYGRRSSMTRADNTQTTYGYDALNRTISIAAGGQIQTFAYDTCTNGEGRLCSVADATGATSYSYSPEGWLTGRGFSVGGTTYSLGYGYNAVGQMAGVVYPDGSQAIYNYTRGVVSSVTLNVGSTSVTGASGITYQPMNAGMSSWTSSNGLVNTLSYDTDGRLTGVGTGSIQSLGLSYDAANRVVGITNGIDGSMTQNFAYDDESRLMSVYSGADVESFQYDADGNRLSQMVNGSSLVYTISSNSNRLTGLSGAVTKSYGYDPQGNTTTVNGSVSYHYDSFNRLSSTEGSSDYVNPEGWRLRKNDASGMSYFAPSLNGSLESEYMNGAWVDYVRLNGRLIGRIADGQVYAIHDDQVGRPEVVTDASGVTVWRAKNFAFDRLVVQDNIAGLNLGFPGQYYDSDTGTWNNGFRDYDEELGRYIESDPMGLRASNNTYTYVDGNPLMRADPYGLYTFQIGFSFTYSFKIPWTSIGAAGTVGVGAAFDTTGQIATYGYYGGAAAYGTFGAAGGVQFAGSNADTVQDLGGKFNDYGLTAADGPGGSLGYFSGKNADGCKNVKGGSLTIGGGAGGYLSVGQTNTYIGPTGQLW